MNDTYDIKSAAPLKKAPWIIHIFVLYFGSMLMYCWLVDKQGYAQITHFLSNYAIWLWYCLAGGLIIEFSSLLIQYLIPQKTFFFPITRIQSRMPLFWRVISTLIITLITYWLIGIPIYHFHAAANPTLVTIKLSSM